MTISKPAQPKAQPQGSNEQIKAEKIEARMRKTPFSIVLTGRGPASESKSNAECKVRREVSKAQVKFPCPPKRNPREL